MADLSLIYVEKLCSFNVPYMLTKSLVSMRLTV